MADWSSHNITLTAKGASALSKVQAGSGSLTITRVVASEQYVAESTLREVTSLSVENLPLTIIDRHEVQDGGSVIQVQLSNLYLGNAFTLNEIGVFATHSDNPSEEFLYIIAQVDADTGDKIPVYATTPVTATYDIYLYNVGADNIEITISSAGLVTYETLNKVCDIIQRNTAYEVGDILHSRSLKKGLSIKCTVAGITKSTDTDLSHKEVGDTVEDGTSQWVVIAPSTTADFDAHNHSLDAHPELVAQIIESGGVNVIKRSHDYAKGDIAYSNKIPSWAFLECTEAGTSSDGWYFPEPSEISVNDTIVDGTVTWKVRKVGSGEGVWAYSETDNSIHPKDTDDLTPEDLDADEGTLKEIVASVVDEKLEYIPIGTVIPFSGNGAIPSGYLLCNGAAVGRSAYSKLFEAIGTTYGEGDGFSTFNLPDLTDKFIEGSSVAGTVKNAGLPNIEGSLDNDFQARSWIVGSASGALSASTATRTNLTSGSGTNSTLSTLSFNARNSNPIYGNSDTVQPPALTMRYIIKAFNGMTHESALIDVTQYGQELANKANRALGNLSADGEDHFLEQDFTIIYPNGGTEESPANVTVNHRYVEANPFSGYHVMCDAEVLINNQWGSVQDFIYNSNGYGVKATQFNDSIIVQTGGTALTSLSASAGNPFGITTSPATTLPCRVKVWKIGKIPD